MEKIKLILFINLYWRIIISNIFYGGIRMETCGKSRHFIREKLTDKEICEAWQQPTHMKRQACYSYIPKKIKYLRNDKQ